jgi:hypothetical protein
MHVFLVVMLSPTYKLFNWNMSKVCVCLENCWKSSANFKIMKALKCRVFNIFKILRIYRFLQINVDNITKLITFLSLSKCYFTHKVLFACFHKLREKTIHYTNITHYYKGVCNEQLLTTQNDLTLVPSDWSACNLDWKIFLNIEHYYVCYSVAFRKLLCVFGCPSVNSAVVNNVRGLWVCLVRTSNPFAIPLSNSPFSVCI